MKKILLLVISSVVVLFGGGDIRYVVSDMHAYAMKKGNANLLIEYLKMNDMLDIFHLKQKELGSSSHYGAIGDMKGYGIGGVYGLSDKTLLHLKYSKQDIGYGAGTLENDHINSYIRYQITHSDFAMINATAVDIGIVVNRAHDLSYSDNRYLEPLATKFLHVKSTKITKNDKGKYRIDLIHSDGTDDYFFNLTQKPAILLKDMEDRSFFVRAIGEKKITNDLYVALFLAYRKTSIKSTITVNDEIYKIAKYLNYNARKSLDRDESRISGGFNISLDWLKMGWELTYTYSRYDRDEGLDYIKTNHVIDAVLSRKITKNILAYSGAKFMYRQFNGEIPYLYNKYTQTTFDHKYGYVKFGLIYRF